MKNLVLDIEKFKKFSDDKPHKEALWTGGSKRVTLFTLKPGQEIKPHVHDGDHIWIVLEGSGEFLSYDDEPCVIDKGKIVIAPSGEGHGIKNHTDDSLVFASITI